MVRTIQKPLAALLSAVILSTGLALPAAAEAHTVTLPSFEDTWTAYANALQGENAPVLYYRWNGEAYATYMRGKKRYAHLAIQLRLDTVPMESREDVRNALCELVASYFDDSYFVRSVDDCSGQTCSIHIADAQRRPETAAIADAFWAQISTAYDVSQYVYYTNVWENLTYDTVWSNGLYADTDTVDVAAVNAYLAEHAPEWYAASYESGVQILHKTLPASECTPNLSADVIADLGAEFGLEIPFRYLPEGERLFGDYDGICKYYIWNMGDVDNNHRIDIADAYAVLCTYTRDIIDGHTADDWDALRDVNKDGTVDADDATLILRYYVNETLLGNAVTWESLTGNA